jgi:hypothetical protein
VGDFFLVKGKRKQLQAASYKQIQVKAYRLKQKANSSGGLFLYQHYQLFQLFRPLTVFLQIFIPLVNWSTGKLVNLIL